MDSRGLSIMPFLQETIMAKQIISMGKISLAFMIFILEMSNIEIVL